MPESGQGFFYLYHVCNRQVDERLFNRGLLSDLCVGFELLAPFYHWLRKLKA